MISRLQRALWVIAGLCWLGFSAVMGACVFASVTDGADLQLFGFLGLSLTAGLGLTHAIGFGAAACVCVVIGAGLFARGVVSNSPRPGNAVIQKSVAPGNPR